MRVNGLISAVMPTFNRGKWVIERIQEIQAQTYDNWELIIVNDCSTDNTIEVVTPFLSDKIKLINLKENSGSVSIPRAIGIMASNGEFISPTDDDVIILPNKFELLLGGMKDDVILTYGNRKDYDIQTEILSTPPTIPDWNPCLPNGWGIDNGQILYRSSVFSTIPLSFPRRACDWELAKSIKSIGNFCHVDKLVSIYLWHEKNRSKDDSTKEKAISPKRYKEVFEKYNHSNFLIEFNN